VTDGVRAMNASVAALLLSSLAVVVLVTVNGVFVAAEFAIVRVRRTRMEELAGEGKAAAKRAIVLIDAVTEYLAVTQIVITTASLGVGWFGEESLSRLFVLLIPGDHIPVAMIHVAGTTLAFLVIVTMHVVMGELVPKHLAIRRAEHLLLVLARPLEILHTLLRPLHWFFDTLANWTLRRLGHGEVPGTALTEEELKLVLTDSHEEGVLTQGEARIMIRAFEFADKDAEEILIPPEHVDFLSLSRSFEENLAVLRRHMHARLPLCRTGLDSVVGVVGMKDAWPLLLSDRSNAAFERAARPTITVPVDLPQDSILHRLQEAHGQMAIVRDQHDQKTLGIVTLEDVLESLVGDVREAPSPERITAHGEDATR
jgi:CBS domain containing-hemolysin-like protein